MFKKIVGLFLVAFAFSTYVFAQVPKDMGKSDSEAKKVLDAVSAKFKTFKSVKASFTLKIENAAGKVQGDQLNVDHFNAKVGKQAEIKGNRECKAHDAIGLRAKYAGNIDGGRESNQACKYLTQTQLEEIPANGSF